MEIPGLILSNAFTIQNGILTCVTIMLYSTKTDRILYAVSIFKFIGDPDWSY